MNLKNATALITGGTSGIGLAIAKTLAHAGTRVAITGRDQRRLDAAARDFGALAIQADVANHADGSVEAVAEGEAEALDRFERTLRRGPSRSRVEQVLVDEVVPTGVHTGFDIR